MKQLPIAVALFGFSFLGTRANAATIDFEAQGASASSAFTGHTDSPLTIGIATFTGGQVLRKEAGGADATAVYATSSLTPGSYTNPITISFSQSISSFSVVIANEIPDTYKITSDLGSSASAFVNGNTRQSLGLADSGILKVNISSSTPSLWDFAIDNVSFAVSTSVPEPNLLSVLGLPLSALLLQRRRARLWGVTRGCP